MIDYEMLELSAKAYGVEVDYRRGSDAFYFDDEEIGRDEWYPLGNDGQTLRLAVKLDMQVTVDLKGGESWVQHNQIKDLVVEEYNGSDPFAATRRAIVRAAAAIGEKL